MVRKVISPLLAVAALSLAFSFNGCSCRAQMGTEQAKAPEPPPPPPPPPPPAPAPAPAPEPVKPKLQSVGRAKIQDNKVEIPGQLEFDVNKATIRDTKESKEILGTLKEFMAQNKGVTKLEIQGHTDNSGTPERNKTLSQERAEAVAKWLADNGVEKTRVVAVGHGQEKPVAANDTVDNKQKNRRTEFHVVEMEGKPLAPTGGASASAPAATPTQNPSEKKPDATPAPAAPTPKTQRAVIPKKP